MGTGLYEEGLYGYCYAYVSHGSKAQMLYGTGLYEEGLYEHCIHTCPTDRRRAVLIIFASFVSTLSSIFGGYNRNKRRLLYLHGLLSVLLLLNLSLLLFIILYLCNGYDN
jgi:hypothetical protein